MDGNMKWLIVSLLTAGLLFWAFVAFLVLPKWLAVH